MSDRRPPAWTAEEDAVLRARSAEGWTAAQIAKQLRGRTTGAVTHRRMVLGVRVKAPRWTPERDAELRRLMHDGLGQSETARRMGVDKNAVIGRARRLGVAAGGTRGSRPKPTAAPATPWTAEETAQLAQMRAKGVSLTACAVRLGRTRGAVCQKTHQLLQAGRVQRTGKNNNPAGCGLVKDGKREAPELPAMPSCTPQVCIADLTHRHCRYIGERPALITIDTLLYCGAQTDGGAWCPAHRAVVYQPQRGPSARALQRPIR